jgi:hypothetical protein
MTVPYTFGAATTSIPLSNLDANFNTPITLGNTSIYLGNTTTTIGNLTLTNATISSGSVTISNVTVTTANVTNITVSGTTTLSGLTASTALALDASKNVVSVTNTGTGNNVLSASPTLTGTIAGASLSLSSLTSGRVTYATTSGLLTDSANLKFNGTDLQLTAGNIYWDVTGVRYISNTGDSSSNINIQSRGYTTFSTGGASVGAGTVQMYLDNSGNLGLGVTPSAWATSRPAFEQIGGSVWSFGTANFYNLQNAYFDSVGFKYKNTAAASSYQQGSGVHYWYNAPSGTAGNAITFNQAMTLNASSNLGIGTTSPTGRLDVVYDNALVGRFYNSGGRGLVRVDGLTDSSFQAYKNGSLVGFFQTDSGGTEIVTGTTTGAFPYSIYTNNTERMRITSAGLVGIGTSSPSYPLSVQTSTTANNRVTGNFYNTGATGTNAFDNWLLRIASNGSGADCSINFTDSVTWNAYIGMKSGALNFAPNSGTTAMTLNTSGYLGIGTTSPTQLLHINSSSDTNIRLTNAVATSGLYIGVNASSYGYMSILDNQPLWFGTNNTERLRITAAGNVGIGTSSPSTALDVVGSINASVNSTVAGVSFSSGTGTALSGFAVNSSAQTIDVDKIVPNHGIAWKTFSDAAGNLSMYMQGYNGIRCYTNGTERMRIDSSGNLGLGVTPSAWGTAYRTAMQVGAGACFAGTSGGSASDYFTIGGNFYLNSSASYRYISTTTANRLEASAGEFRFYNAPSGTAGTAITFTQAMTLTSAGQLLIGSTSATDAQLVVSNAGTNGMEFSTTAISGENRILSYNRSTSVYQAQNLVASQFKFFIAGTQSMTLDSSGNLGLGVVPSAWDSGFKALQIGAQSALSYASSATYLSTNYYRGTNFKYLTSNYATDYYQSLGAHVWRTAASGTAGNDITFTQAMTLDSSGNLLVGATTGTSAQLRVHTAGTLCSFMQNSAAAPNGLQIYYSNATAPNNTASEFLYFSDTSALRMSVRSNGGIANYTANNVVLSDKREKINFAPSKSYLDVICAIPVQTFNYIDQNLETDAGLTLGVTAQDVQAVAPELVSEGN